jgi:hypothetical protein
MSHRHYCDVTGHFWECYGLRPFAGESEPSICMCRQHRVPMAVGDHSGCRIESLACPEHLADQLRAMQEAKQAFERRKREFGLDEKFVRMQSMPSGPEQDAAAQEILDWSFEN